MFTHRTDCRYHNLGTVLEYVNTKCWKVSLSKQFFSCSNVETDSGAPGSFTSTNYDLSEATINHYNTKTIDVNMIWHLNNF